MEKVCRIKANNRIMKVNEIQEEDEEDQGERYEDIEKRYEIISSVEKGTFRYLTDYIPPYFEEVNFGNKTLQLLCDTGSAYTLVPHEFHSSLESRPHIQPFAIPLKSCTNQTISILGMATYDVFYREKHQRLRALVVKGGKALMGRNWLKKLGIFKREEEKMEINEINGRLAQLLDQYDGVFSEELGCFKGSQLKLEGAVPPFNKARSIPFAKKEKAEKELQRMVAQ